jgi:pilus assembly protein CpaE
MTHILVLAANPDLTRVVESIPDHHVKSLARTEVDQFARQAGVDALSTRGGEPLPDVVIIGDEIPTGEALSIAQIFDGTVPDIELMLVAEVDADLALRAMRVGIREIVSPNIAQDDLKVLLHRAGASVSNRMKPFIGGDGAAIGESRIIVVASPKGGVGKSTIAVNLAVALAAEHPMQAVLVDLDVQFGDVATLLDLKPTHTIADAFGTSAALDTLILKTFLTVHSAGFYVLCGADSPTVGDQVSSSHVTRLLTQLSSQFAHVIVDTSAGLSEHTLAALEVANDVVLVSSMDVSSIRSLRREVDVLSELSLLPSSRHVLLNFADRSSGLAVRDVEEVVGMPVDVVVPRSADVPLAGNRGEPFMLKKRGGPINKSIQALADRMTTDQAKESWLSKRRKHAGVKS